MYGNTKLPGVSVSDTYKVSKGSIWRGYPEATWFKAVSVNGNDGTDIPLGTIMKELTADGSYIPIAETDIITSIEDLPGARLAIVADNTAKTGVTAEVDGETETTPASVLVGISGVVDKAKLFIGDKSFTELTDAQKIALNTQLETWGFLLVNVLQA